MGDLFRMPWSLRLIQIRFTYTNAYRINIQVFNRPITLTDWCHHSNQLLLRYFLQCPFTVRLKFENYPDFPFCWVHKASFRPNLALRAKRSFSLSFPMQFLPFCCSGFFATVGIQGKHSLLWQNKLRPAGPFGRCISCHAMVAGHVFQQIVPEHKLNELQPYNPKLHSGSCWDSPCRTIAAQPWSISLQWRIRCECSLSNFHLLSGSLGGQVLGLLKWNGTNN